MTYSYSDLLTFQRCPKKFEFSVIQNLEPRRQNKKLALGIMFHELLMGHYLGVDMYWELSEKAHSGEWQIDDEISAAPDVLHEAEKYVNRYLDYYTDEWEILHCEETFVAAVDGVEVSFTPDLVIRDSQGVWVVDHKTTAALPKEDLPVGNFQAFLYSAVMREIYPDFKGFIFNYVRKKLPTQPRLTKTGEKRVADIGRIDTTYEMLRDFLVAEAPDLLEDPTHRRRLAELKDRNRFFWRQHVYTTPEMSDQILEDVKIIVQQVEVCREANHYPRSFLPYAGAQECDHCPFKDLCVAQLRGYNTEAILPLYQERDMSHRQYEHDLEDLLG